MLACGNFVGCTKTEDEMNYTYPEESSLHAGTWLTWPHEYTYGKKYKNEIEPVWIAMTKNLIESENVYIIAYDNYEKEQIINTLRQNNIVLDKIEFYISKSNDVWVRDTGPIFVKDTENKMHIADFGFDGWGKKCKYKYDDIIPKNISEAIKIPQLDISDFILEGGSVELDGDGTCMATLSSVVSKNRNPKLSVKDAEYFLNKYFGATNFIWLEGVLDEDITDAHIDGMARFYDKHTLITVSEDDFHELYESIKISDYYKLTGAKNANKENYEIITMPLTANNVVGLDYKGSYLNYYIANSVVLMPSYNDENDKVARNILQNLYPNKKVVAIDVTKLFKYGGMIHCITQQQPA